MPDLYVAQEMTDYYSKYLTLTREMVLRHVPLEGYAIFFFGSHARGTMDRGSDLDVGIIGDRPLSPVVKSRINRDIEDSHIPWKVDVVDFSRTHADFDALALQDVVVWNNPFDADLETLIARKVQANAK